MVDFVFILFCVLSKNNNNNNNNIVSKVRNYLDIFEQIESMVDSLLSTIISKVDILT